MVAILNPPKFVEQTAIEPEDRDGFYVQVIYGIGANQTLAGASLEVGDTIVGKPALSDYIIERSSIRRNPQGAGMQAVCVARKVRAWED